MFKCDDDYYRSRLAENLWEEGGGQDIELRHAEIYRRFLKNHLQISLNDIKFEPYTELFFKLCCKLNIATLMKMPQYKDKKGSVDFDLGLLLYPVLMTADIMINDPDFVIVGKDQTAHLDLCNDISKRVGGKYYNYELTEFDKVMSLVDPTKKMSKSLGERHVLYIFDENYEAKIKSANTTEIGLDNLKKIGKGIGVNVDGYEMNVDLKKAISDQMETLFGK